MRACLFGPAELRIPLLCVLHGARVLTATGHAHGAPSRALTAQTAPDGGFVLSVGGVPWLASAESGPVSLFAGGREWSVGLERDDPPTATGEDALGRWTADVFVGRLEGGAGRGSAGPMAHPAVRVEAAVRRYEALAAITFDVTLPDGANGTQRATHNASSPDVLPYGDVPPALSYPSFGWSGRNGSLLPELGFLTIHGDQVGSATWGWGADGATPPAAGRSGGPVVLFSDPREAAVLLCPLTHVAAAVSHLNSSAGVWAWGPSGELDSLPPGFSHRTLAVLGIGGVTDAWSSLGDALRLLNPGVSEARKAAQAHDLNLAALSYYTDAGTEYLNGANVSTIAAAVASGGVPYRLIQLDDWAHQSTQPVNCGCLSKWAGDPRWFGDGGWRGLVNATGLPLALYLPGAGICNGAGASEFNVSTYTGRAGKAAFEVPTPADARKFFDQIVAGGTAQGMGGTMEIDFLDFAFLQTPEFRTRLGDYARYFAALGASARAGGVAVQLCMTLPHHHLAAAAMPHITSSRVGMDYDWPTNCDIGVTSFLPWAVGLAPSKDAFMTSNRSKVVMGPPFFKGGLGNPGANCELNAVIATLSTGPVGVGDGVGATDPTVIAPTIDAAGNLLKPSKPLTAVDATFCRDGQDERGAPSGRCKSAWMSGADGGAVWTSYTRLSLGAPLTHYALAINVSHPWPLRRNDLWPRGKHNATYVTRVWSRGRPCVNNSAAVQSGCVVASPPGATFVDLRSRSALPSGGYVTGESPFVLAAVHELLPNGWTVWEEGKYAAVSVRRFARVAVASGGGVDVTVRGALGEVVRLVALRPHRGVPDAGEEPTEWAVVTARVRVSSPDGTASVRIV